MKTDTAKSDCHKCGKPFFTTPQGITHHGSPDAIDHDQDGDHVPYSLEPVIEVEKGAAEINILKQDGIITVTHSDGAMLHQIEDVEQGSWDKIWDAIRSIRSVNKAE